MRALILCAGRGERLRPLTDRVPKPLLEVDGAPLLVHHLRRLRDAGVTDVVINVSWLAEAIVAAVGDGAEYGIRVTYSVEPPGALETLGGIRQALPWLGDAPFWVVNGDVYTDVDFTASTAVLDDTTRAELVLVPNPGHNPGGDFDLVDGRVVRGQAAGRPYTFAGVGRYRPAFFAGVEPGRAPLGPLLFAAADAGRLAGRLHVGRWDDVGTPERLATLRHWLATPQDD